MMFFLDSALKGNILLHTVVCTTLIVQEVFLEIFPRRERESYEAARRERKTSDYL